jgi:DNA-binding NtrC family response regulator
MRPSILVVDDNPINLESTRQLLESYGFRVESAELPSQALETLQVGKDVAVILLDYKMPEMDGAKLAEEIQKFNEESVILMYSCEDSRDAIKHSFRARVTDFIDKDENIGKLISAVKSGFELYESRRTIVHNENQEQRSILSELGLIGSSHTMMRVAALTKQFRTMDEPVLITGETGTGKELIAKALNNSTTGELFVVNCAAFANSGLIEAELFGYEKGSFTGAIARKLGILEVANKGTVFLDELHHLSLSSQASLLRAIREKKIRRVGGSEEITIRCRIIAATKPDIQERVQNKEFLADLYYRLKHLMIEIPSLKDRKEDIPLLVTHFANEFNKKHGTSKKLLARTIRALEEYSWPGNIGELQGLITNLLASSSKNTIEPKDLDSHLERVFEEIEISALTMEAFELKQFREKLKFIESINKTSTSQRHTASRLGISESTLRGYLAKSNKLR